MLLHNLVIYSDENCITVIKFRKICAVQSLIETIIVRVKPYLSHLDSALKNQLLLLFTKLETAEFSPFLATVIFIGNCNANVKLVT